MIACITGRPIKLEEHAVLLDVSGVGYRVYALNETLAGVTPESGGSLRLWTHLVVRENSLDLYGFVHPEECHFFELLLTISGIGPKSALAILNLAPRAVLASAIRSGDTSYLTKVSGIGRKNAEKIVLELRDKLERDSSPEGTTDIPDVDALDALMALGYNARDAREALRRTEGRTGETAERVREALKTLAARSHDTPREHQ